VASGPVSKNTVLTVAGVALVAIAVGVFVLFYDRTAAPESASNPSFSTDSATTKSVGQLIDESEVILLAGMTETPVKTFWNSADGTNWLEDFQRDPDRFPTAPNRIASVVLRVNLVIDARSGQPPFAEGDSVEVWFSGGAPNLLVSDVPRNLVLEAGNWDRQALFFLHRTTFWLAGPRGDREASDTEVWWSASSPHGVWASSPREVLMPMSTEEYYQLAGAARRREISSASAGRRQGITVRTLQGIISEERKSPDDDSYASFSAWPWEPAYGEDAQENA
jgi:hypothetical protein